VFFIEKSAFGSATEIIVSNSAGVCMKILPAFGANIRELFLLKNKMPFQILDGFRTPAQLMNNEKSRNILLIPFPNRICDGTYNFEGKTYKLPINKPKEQNAIHGFVWNKHFEITESLLLEHKAIITLQYQYPGDYEGFPFPFRTQLRYTLSENELIIAIHITNTGTSGMPLGIGWHPYYTLQKNINELYLQLPACDMLETDSRMIPTGRKIAFQKFDHLNQIQHMHFDHCLVFKNNAPVFETILRDPVLNHTLRIWQENVFGYMQIYIPPDRNCIALEPMTCAVNAFNNREGLIVLHAGQTTGGSLGVKLC
jgi:aldose 1-epimerase